MDGQNVASWWVTVKPGDELMTRGGMTVKVLENGFSRHDDGSVFFYCVVVSNPPENGVSFWKPGMEYNEFIDSKLGNSIRSLSSEGIVGTMDDYYFCQAMEEVNSIAPGWTKDMEVF